MQVTRRYWAAVGLIGFLMVAGVVLAHPLLVAGATGLGAWLLAQHLLFAWTTRRLADGVRVRQTIARDRIAVDEPVTCGLTATIPAVGLLPVTVTIEAGVPLGATGDGATRSDRQLTWTPTELAGDAPADAACTFTVTWPVAGQVTFAAPTVTVTDTQGLCRTTFAGPATAPPTVTVAPPQPQALHIGAGGDPATAVLGNHSTNREGMGLDPATVREYTPGDALRQIDWKATARSATPYVRTFTEHTEYGTALIVDHRAAMHVGTPGETKLAYARQVALAVVDQAETQGNGLGLHAVGDAGVTARQPLRATMETYATIRTTLHELTPTHDPATATATTQPAHTAGHGNGAEQPAPTAATPTRAPRRADADRSAPAPTVARHVASTLATEESSFATTLQPFFAAAQTYVQRIETTPLYRTVRTLLGTGGTTEHHRPERTVIVTDDTNRAEVREAVTVARNQSEQVLVFLTPTVLFEPDGLADLETAYDRYTAFERFRRQLTTLDRVNAFEVAPGDRLATIQRTAPAATAPSSRDD